MDDTGVTTEIIWGLNGALAYALSIIIDMYILMSEKHHASSHKCTGIGRPTLRAALGRPGCSVGEREEAGVREQEAG